MVARRSFAEGRARRVLAAVAVALLVAEGAAACAVCFNGRIVTLGQRLDGADQAVFAVPLSRAGLYRVTAVIKGDLTEGAMLTAQAQLTPEPGTDGGAQLLVRNALGGNWSSLGEVGREYAVWLRQVAGTARLRSEPRPASGPARLGSFPELTDEAWRERLSLVITHLEDEDPLIAELAYGEVAAAPYDALRALEDQLDAVQLKTWVYDPRLSSRRAAYTVLLGIAGASGDAAELERRIDLAWSARDATNLAPMLTADLELRGPERVAWIEAAYLADRDRTLPEIEAALLALEVHGDADGGVPRSRVIEAYRLFIRERKPMAGFVALQLAKWEAWGATADYLALLETNAVKDPAGEFAVLSYLQRSPVADAKAALQSFLGRSN